MSYQIIFTGSLSHHGVKGQKWGIRHYQNEDGSYKSGAQGRYNSDGKPGVNVTVSRNSKLASKKPKVNKLSKSNSKSKDNKKKNDNLNKNQDKKQKKKMSTKKKVAIGAAVVGGTVLAAYGAHKYRQFVKDKASKAMLAKGEKAFQKTMMAEQMASRNKRWDESYNLYKSAHTDYDWHKGQAKKLKEGSYKEARNYLKSEGVSVLPKIRRR